MALNAEVHWIKDLGFEVQVRDHHLFTDAKKESGGGNRGPNPKEYLLSGLIGCTGMDVVSLLKKYNVTFESFDIKVETELTTEHPHVFTDIHMNFYLIGATVDPELFKKAVDLSMTKYCGVSAMLSKSSDIHYHLFLNQNAFHQGKANFAKTV